MLALKNSSFLLAKSSRLSTVNPAINKQKDYSRQSSRQCLFETVFGNGSILLWCIGSTFQHTFHLWPWHMVRQKLCRILKKCLKVYMLLRYLTCTKLHFLQNSTQDYDLIFPKPIGIYRMLEKVKI